MVEGPSRPFGLEDDKGYLHKYSISESIQDGHHATALLQTSRRTRWLVPHDLLEKEFLSLAETEGIADIEELNRIL